MRTDFDIIDRWIPPGARVLDLGCGDGLLLATLEQTRQARGVGLEIDEDKVVRCIARGVRVIQFDLDAGLKELFDNDSFDYVVMSQTIQAVHHPDMLLEEMLRVGRTGIVTFPNIGHWRNRTQLLFQGIMPQNRVLPNEWYSNPNIHLCTLRDFESLCQKKSIRIERRTVADHTRRRSFGSRLLPNLLGEVAVYRIGRDDRST